MFDKRLVAFFSLRVFFLASALYDRDKYIKVNTLSRSTIVLCVLSIRSRLIYEVS